MVFDLHRCALQASLTNLKAPGILVFLHCLPSAVLLWAVNTMGITRAIKLGPFTGCSLKGCMPSILLSSLQVHYPLQWCVTKTSLSTGLLAMDPLQSTTRGCMFWLVLPVQACVENCLRQQVHYSATCPVYCAFVSTCCIPCVPAVGIT